MLLWEWHEWLWFRAVFASMLGFEAVNQLLCLRDERLARARAAAAAARRRAAWQAELRESKARVAHANMDNWDLWSAFLVMHARYGEESEGKNAEDDSGGGEPVR